MTRHGRSPLSPYEKERTAFALVLADNRLPLIALYVLRRFGPGTVADKVTPLAPELYGNLPDDTVDWFAAGGSPIQFIVTPRWPDSTKRSMREAFGRGLDESFKENPRKRRQRPRRRPARAAFWYCEHRFLGKSYRELAREWRAMTYRWCVAKQPATPEEPVYEAYGEWRAASDKIEEATSLKVDQQIRRFRMPRLPRIK